MGYINNDGMFKTGDSCWFVGRNDRILYKMNSVSLKTEAVCILENETASDFRMFQRCIVWKNKVYCLPDRGNSIQIYDIKEKKLDKIIIDTHENDRLCILNAWIEGVFLWCVAFGSSELIKVDLDKKSVILKEKLFAKDENVCGYESIKIGKMIYCVSRNHPLIIKINIDTLEKKEYLFKIDENGFNTIAFDGGCFYLTGFSPQIYKWSESTNILSAIGFQENPIKVLNDEETDMWPIFRQTIILHDYIVFIPWVVEKYIGDALLVWDRRKDKFEYIDFSNACFSDKKGENFVFEYLVNNQTIVIYDCKRDKMSEVSLGLRTSKEIDMEIDALSFRTINIVKDIFLHNRVYENNERYGLEDLIKVLNVQPECRICQKELFVGEKILEMICDSKHANFEDS